MTDQLSVTVTTQSVLMMRSVKLTILMTMTMNAKGKVEDLHCTCGGGCVKKVVKTSTLTIEIIILMTRIGENPMAKYSLKDFVKVLKSMRSLRVAFDNLMEGYRCLVLVTLIIILHMYCQGVQE